MIIDLNTQSRTAKIALLVMGVGRSGTSALTRVLSLLGAGLPQDIMGAAPSNERGHWEPNRIVGLSDDILRMHDRDWFDYKPFPQAWFYGPDAEVYVGRAAAILEAEYKGAPLIVIKDPRICRLAPIYLAALKRVGYSSRIIIPLRHPSEVIASLQHRNGTDPRVGELIWTRHILDAEAATREYTRVWVSYDGLLDDWQQEMTKIASVLDIAWPNSPATVSKEIAAFLEPTLRHFDSRTSMQHVAIGPEALKIWQTVQLGLAGLEVELRVRLDAARNVAELPPV